MSTIDDRVGIEMVMATQNDVDSAWGKIFGEFVIVRFALVCEGNDEVRACFAQTRGQF